MHIQAKPRLLIVAGNTHFVRVFLAQQIELLVSEGFEVLLICSPDGAKLSLPCAIEYIQMARTIAPFEDFQSLVRLYRCMRLWSPTIVHSHSPKAGLLGSLAALLAGVKNRLHTIHGLRSEGLQGGRRALVRCMERLTTLCCTACFAVSRSLRQEVVAQGICPAQKLSVIGEGSWAGVSTEEFDPLRRAKAGTSFRRTHGITHSALVVTYIGRLARDKGLETLAAAWQLLQFSCPSAWLLVAGPQDASDPVPAAVLDSLRSDRRVVMLDRFVDDVPALLAASDIFVQPSFREGLGVSALEASAMKVPVVASQVTGLVDAVDHERTGLLVPAAHVRSLAVAIRRFVEDADLRRRFGSRGREFVEARFERGAVLAGSLQMYRTCLSSQRPETRMKRIFDVSMAALLLCITLPLTSAVSLAVLLLMGLPVFFSQERAGLQGRPFRLYKFRTMRSPALGQAMFGTDHQRSHWFGDLLRRLSIDELPQLINILRGEMSLVGPRPLLVDYLPRYDATEARRHEVKPGVTGWAQVNGRNALSWSRKFALDVWYVDHRSFSLDLRILWLTAKRLIRTADVTPPGLTAMPEFLGSTQEPPPELASRGEHYAEA